MRIFYTIMQLQPRPCGRGCQLVEKVCFFKKVLVLNPYPQTPFPGKGAILLGLPPLDPVGGYAPATPFLYNQEVYRQSDSPDLAVGAVCSYLTFILSLSAFGKIYPERYLKDIIACRNCDISVCDCQLFAFV